MIGGLSDFRKNGLRFGGLLLALFLVSGCRSTLPATHYYVLTPLPEAAGGEGDLTLEVQTFLVDPPYDRDAVVYRLGADTGEVGFYAYHRWASPLGRLVSVALAEGLRGTPGLGRVEPSGSMGSERPSHLLRGRVVRAGEIGRAGGVEAHFELDVELLDLNAGVGGDVVWTQRVAGSAEGNPASAGEFMELLQQAFDQAVREIRLGLAETLEEPT